MHHSGPAAHNPWSNRSLPCINHLIYGGATEVEIFEILSIRAHIKCISSGMLTVSQEMSFAFQDATNVIRLEPSLSPCIKHLFTVYANEVEILEIFSIRTHITCISSSVLTVSLEIVN